MAGLDPAIDLLRKTLPKRMDARVKPAHDAVHMARAGVEVDALHLIK
jgi:hypothetical protein